MEAGYGHFVCSFWRLMEGDKTNKRQNEISFLRFGDLYNATKRTNDKVTAKYQTFDLSWLLVRFVVCSFCRLPQGAKTNKRQRDKMKFCGHFVLSFVRFVALYKSPKRRNENSFWRFFVLSPSIKRQNKQTKWPYPASILNRLSYTSLLVFFYKFFNFFALTHLFPNAPYIEETFMYI